MADQDLDQSEAATPYKLDKARERGQVGKSSEVVGAAVFAAAVIYFYAQGGQVAHELMRLFQALLTHAGRAGASPAEAMDLVAHTLIGGLLVLAPLFCVIVLTAIVANVVQTGPVFSFEPISPDFSRLNPVNGFKKIFSARSLFDLLRSCVKLALLGLVVYQALASLFPHFFQLAALSAPGYLRTLIDALASLGLKMAAMLGLIALVDAIYSHREFGKKMKMSKREVRDEHKQRDGDPRIRSRMRQLQRDMLKRSASLGHTKKADVLITNPTHLAIALRYSHGDMDAPQIVSKGAGLHAAVMRNIARRYHIPIVQNRPLARKLYRMVDVEQTVPSSLYAEVARIMIWVLAMRRAAGVRA